ncbi:class I SAM-dependent methyltransferase [Hymenobacter sp. BT730]|uniref:class I SAM-dependent methyltransferase n=1 Tax=Hymenobacter sp. BT730 TaxID=3063332 RepID=UPI0026DF0F1E|nr:class I SAM-dependent methyltransferase [Hymenobacter sp. BT730]
MPLPDAGFDRVAAFYDPLARLVFGRSLLRAQRLALEGLPAGAPRVLIIGGGSGWVLPEVLRRRPAAHILYIEASPAMLRRSQQTLQGLSPTQQKQVEFRLGTEDSLLPTEAFDVIVTFFFLDLFPAARLRHIVSRLAAVRKPQAPWLLADFAPPRTAWQKLLLASMYRFFGLTTGIQGRKLPPIREELARVGLLPTTRHTVFGGMAEAVVYVDKSKS